MRKQRQYWWRKLFFFSKPREEGFEVEIVYHFRENNNKNPGKDKSELCFGMITVKQ
jgi:hypothetical protein